MVFADDGERPLLPPDPTKDYVLTLNLDQFKYLGLLLVDRHVVVADESSTEAIAEHDMVDRLIALFKEAIGYE